MNEDDKSETVSRYSSRLTKYGYSEETLGWSRQKNDLRFKILVGEWLAELEGATIGDFGCGFGDLFKFLKTESKVSNFSYLGIDINAELVQIGREKYPEADFWVGDIVKDPLDKRFDFIFSSGVFNHQLTHEDEYRFIEECLTRLNQLSVKGFAVNFLSDKVDFKAEHTFHSNPGRILEIVYRFSNHIVLRNDYMPFEFTVFVRKDRRIDPAKVIYSIA